MKKQASFLTPISFAVAGESLTLGPGVRIQKDPPLDFIELKRWDFLIGEDLLKVEDQHHWLIYDYEYEDTGDVLSMYANWEEGLYAAAALQILAPMSVGWLRIICVEDDGKLRPRSVGRGERLNGTKWCQRAAYPVDQLKHVAWIVERLKQAYAADAQRIVNPTSLLFAGLTSTNRRVRTLLWTVAIDALLMAANREQFCTRILALLDAATVILPPGVDGVRPKYNVADVIESLYDYRGYVAHGRKVSSKFLKNTGLLSVSGSVIIPEFTWEELLEEAALFLLHRCLKLVLTSDLFLEIQTDPRWRKRLKSKKAFAIE